MLTRAERLNRSEFSTFFNRGRRINSPHLTLVISPHSQFHGSVVVGKKVAKRAVLRNTIRRRIYAALYRLKRGGSRGVFIIVVKPSFALLTKKQAAEETANLIERTRKST
jgi:ribonuclease P protein component